MSIPEAKMYNDARLDAGKITQHHPAEYTISALAEGKIPFGCAVVKGRAAQKVKLPVSAGDRMFGVSAYSFEASHFEEGYYADGDKAGVHVTGIVSVLTIEEVEPGDAVRVVLGTDDAGKFCKTSADGVTARVTNAEWKTETDEAGLAELFINGPFELVEDTE